MQTFKLNEDDLAATLEQLPWRNTFKSKQILDLRYIPTQLDEVLRNRGMGVVIKEYYYFKRHRNRGHLFRIKKEQRSPKTNQ